MAPEVEDERHITRLLSSYLIQDDNARKNYQVDEIKAIAKGRKMGFEETLMKLYEGIARSLFDKEVSKSNKEKIKKVANDLLEIEFVLNYFALRSELGI